MSSNINDLIDYLNSQIDNLVINDVIIIDLVKKINNDKEKKTIPQQYYEKYKHNYKKYYETHKEEIKERSKRRYKENKINKLKNIEDIKEKES